MAWELQKRMRMIDRLRGGRFLPVLLVGAALVSVGASDLFGQRGRAPVETKEDVAEKMQLLRQVLDQSFEIQRQISDAQGERQLTMDLLQSRINLIRAEIDGLKEKTTEQEASITEADKETDELVTENEALETVQAMQKENVDNYERRVRDVSERLPEVLKVKIQPLLDRLPDPATKAEDIKASVSERYQTVLGILNEINKFNTDIHVVRERRKASDGREVEVDTMYVGLAKAYYAGEGETAEIAGVGTVGPTGWAWAERPELGNAIRELIGVHAGKNPAAFVVIPVTIE